MEKGLTAWYVNAQGVKARANALLDDLRVWYALRTAARKWGRDYSAEATDPFFSFSCPALSHSAACRFTVFPGVFFHTIGIIASVCRFFQPERKKACDSRQNWV